MHRIVAHNPGGSGYDPTTDPKFPNWRLDAYKPYYTPIDIVYGCGGVTLYDTPYILLSGPETWRFTADDYVIVGQRVIMRVEWVKERGPNGAPARYTKATVEPNAGVVAAELRTLLRDNRLPVKLLP